MPDQKISDMTTATTPDGSESAPIVQGGANRKVLLSTLFAAAIASGGALASLDTVGAGEIDDEAIGINHLADGTDGTLISWDTSGEAVVIAVGTAGQILTSQGAGAVPTWETASGGYTDEEAQDAVGAMVNGSLTYTDGTPLLTISDSDKGDITTSSAGTSWQIDASSVGTSEIAADAVAYGDMQNVSAASRVMCRGSSGGAGDMEECTIGASIGMTGTLLHLGARDYGDFTCTGTAATCTIDTGAIVTGDISDGTITLVDFDSTAIQAGTWTPTLTGVANVTSSTAFQCQYLRAGLTASASCKIEVTATAGETLTRLGISLPSFNGSNFGAEEDCAGTAVPANDLAAYVVGDATNDRCELKFTFASSGSYTFFATFVWQIL
jgi:hypothetical protein